LGDSQCKDLHGYLPLLSLFFWRGGGAEHVEAPEPVIEPEPLE